LVTQFTRFGEIRFIAAREGVPLVKVSSLTAREAAFAAKALSFGAKERAFAPKENAFASRESVLKAQTDDFKRALPINPRF